MTTFEEQKINRGKWIAALRSGEFKQAIGTLENDSEGFCCLGVLAKIAGCERTIKDRHNIFYDEESGFAPVRAREWAGLLDGAGQSNPANISLTHLNDTKGYNFDQIADYLEKNESKYFTMESARQ